MLFHSTSHIHDEGSKRRKEIRVHLGILTPIPRPPKYMLIFEQPFPIRKFLFWMLCCVQWFFEYKHFSPIFHDFPGLSEDKHVMLKFHDFPGLFLDKRVSHIFHDFSWQFQDKHVSHIYRDLWWFSVIFFDLLRFSMICHNLPQFAIIFHNFSWQTCQPLILIFHDFPWFAMIF